MKTVSLREVQRNLATVLDLVTQGQEIAITRRGLVIARIVPARAVRAAIEWPGAATRIKRLEPVARSGTPSSRLIQEMRGERF